VPRGKFVRYKICDEPPISQPPRWQIDPIGHFGTVRPVERQAELPQEKRPARPFSYVDFGLPVTDGASAIFRNDTMPSLVTRLLTLKAVDVMTSKPVTLVATASLASAVATLERHHITGAPVVDDAGKVIGMFSLWDFVRSQTRAGRSASQNLEISPQNSPAGARVPALIDSATVADWMSRTEGSVPRDQLLVEVARTMCIAHWHRVPVVMSDGQLVGIISTMDVLAAVVNLFDELQ
jgi:CBS domain-containing protein